MFFRRFFNFKSGFIFLLNNPIVFVYIAVFIYTAFFSYLSFFQYFSFEYTNDLCVWDHTIWKMISGRPLYGLFDMGTDSFSWQLVHFSPITIFLAMIYFFIPTPLLLLFVQSLFIGLGAIPLYKLSKEKLNSVAGGLVFSICYLLYPAVQGANLYEFHPVVISIPLLIWAFYFAEKNAYKKSVIFSTLSLFCKESVSWVVILLGTYLLFRNKKKLGLTLIIIGFFWISLTQFVILPNVYGTNSLHYTYRLSELGDTPFDQISTFLSSPVYAFTRSVPSERIGLLLQMLLPLAFFSLFSPILLIVLPGYILHLLTDFPCTSYYCTALLIPFTFIAAIYGVKNISSFLSRRIRSANVLKIILFIVLVMSIYSSILFSPFWKKISHFRIEFPIDDHYINLKNMVSSIPKNSTVLVQNSLCVHASHFKDIHILFWYLDEKMHKQIPKKVDFMIIDRMTLNLHIIERESEILDKSLLYDFIKINSKDGIEIYKSIQR